MFMHKLFLLSNILKYGSDIEKIICNQKVKVSRKFITIIKIQKTLVTFRKWGIAKLWFKAHWSNIRGKTPHIGLYISCLNSIFAWVLADLVSESNLVITVVHKDLCGQFCGLEILYKLSKTMKPCLHFIIEWNFQFWPVWDQNLTATQEILIKKQQQQTKLNRNKQTNKQEPTKNSKTFHCKLTWLKVKVSRWAQCFTWWCGRC